MFTKLIKEQNCPVFMTCFNILGNTLSGKLDCNEVTAHESFISILVLEMIIVLHKT